MNKQLIISNKSFLKNVSQDDSEQVQYIINYFEIEILLLRRLKLYSYYIPVTASPIQGINSPSKLSQMITYFSSKNIDNSLYGYATRCFDISNATFVSDKNKPYLTNLYSNISEYIGILYDFF